MAMQLKRLEIEVGERWKSRRLWVGIGSLLLLTLLRVAYKSMPWDAFLQAFVAIVGIVVGVIGVTDLAEHFSATKQAGYDAQLEAYKYGGASSPEPAGEEIIGDQ